MSYMWVIEKVFGTGKIIRAILQLGLLKFMRVSACVAEVVDTFVSFGFSICPVLIPPSKCIEGAWCGAKYLHEMKRSNISWVIETVWVKEDLPKLPKIMLDTIQIHTSTYLLSILDSCIIKFATFFFHTFHAKQKHGFSHSRVFLDKVFRWLK